MGVREEVQKLSDKIDALVTREQADQDKLTAQITDLTNQIAALKDQIAQGNNDPDIIAALQAAEARLDEIRPDVPPVEPPTP